MIYALIGCLLIIGFLGYKLFQKQKIDRYELEEYKTQLRQTQQQIQQKYKEFDAISRDLIEASSELVRAKEDTAYEKSKLEECRKDLQAALDTYTDITDNKLKEIETTMTE